MQNNPTAEIVAIGTEILLGELTDTNSVYIARLLRDYGINLYFMTSVGDNIGRIAEALRIAMNRADVIITCGGLGPTVDDMTRQAVAQATGRELVFQQALLAQIEARFKLFRATMTENNRRQAYLPDGALTVENPVGTAPAFIVEHEGSSIISLPGVPREMKFLMQERVVPYLRERYALGIIKARIIKTAGIGESALDEMLGDELLNRSNPTVGLAAHHGIIDIRMTAKADSEAIAETMLDACEQDVMARARAFIFGKDDDELEPILLQFLHDHDAKLALVEAGISGAIIARLAGLPDAGQVLAATDQYEHPDILRQALALPDISMRDLALAVAEKACKDNRAQAGIAILALPDVDESADTNEAGAVAIYTPNKQMTRVYGFGGKSKLARDWMSRWAMANVWRVLGEVT